MSVTATKQFTTRDALNTSKEGQMDDAMHKVQMGDVLVPMHYTVSGLTPSNVIDITSAAVAAAAVPSAGSPSLTTPDDITRLPAALMVSALRVVAGAAAAGPRLMSDAAATPSATVATLSDDGKTLTFENDVTDFVLQYMPRSASDLLAQFTPAP